jgi:glycosyltransferase involved in cell wall biosynthesis
MMVAGTIVARNYLAQAQVLVDSFLDHHPDGEFYVLVVDDPATPAPKVRGAEVLMLDQIGIHPADLDRMTVAYEIIELATAVKPWLLTTMLDRGADHAVYFDPDILIARRIEELPGLARAHSIVLTPHLTEPMPRDGCHPNEQSILVAGTYNLGFIAVGDTPEARRMLAWWSERLRTDSLVAVAQGFFTDQKWIDFVPGLFDVHLVKDPSWNVAYWNLATRPVSRSEDGGFLVSGRPLTFAHLSGYSPRQPHLLSKHQGRRPRVLLSEEPALRELCDEYGSRLTKAGFHDSNKRFVPPFSTYDGVVVDPLVRALVRTEIQAQLVGEGTGLGWPDTPGISLDEWLTAPRTEDPATEPNLGLYMSTVYRMRPDVQMEYPEVGEGDISGFLTWVEEFGIAELDVHPDMLDRAKAHWATMGAMGEGGAGEGRPAARALLPGLEVVGYFTADLGIAEAARQVVTSLEGAGIPLSTRTYTRTLSRLGTPWTDRSAPEGGRYDTALVCVNADSLPTLARDYGPGFFEGRYTIGLWFWELAQWPETMTKPALRYVDEIWVSSEFGAAGLRRVTDKPVRVMPQPAHAPAPSDVRIPELEDDLFTFLFVFDYLSVFERKNPVGVVDAFAEAFPDPGKARLVIKSINGDRRPVDRERLLYAIGDRPDIALVERYLDRDELDGLMWNADCYVSLHRSEGFGQTMAEMMAIGKPVIATRYSGNLAFMDETNSLLVGQKWTPVPAGCDPYPDDIGLGWAKPIRRQAVQAMRRMVEEPALREQLGAQAARTIADNFSAEALGLAAKARLDEIRELRSQTPVGRLLAESRRRLRAVARSNPSADG